MRKPPDQIAREIVEQAFMMAHQAPLPQLDFTLRALITDAIRMDRKERVTPAVEDKK